MRKMNANLAPSMRLSIDQDDFGKIMHHQLIFVDKSLFIRDILQDMAEVILITRLRRFGKTQYVAIVLLFCTRSPRS